MSLDELRDKYMKLRADLARAYAEPIWNSRHIDRLTDEISATEFSLARAVNGAIGLFRPQRFPARSAVAST